MPDSADVARRVVAQLLHDGYTAGDRLPSERRLAAEIGVGRSVVREALRSLSLLGIVDLRRGDGTYLTVASAEPLARATELGQLLGPGRVVDLATVSAELEVVASGLAGERRTEAVLHAMDDNQEALERSLGRTPLLIEVHRQFHGLVWEAASNHVLEQILGSMCSLLDHAFGRAAAAEPDRTWIARDHRAVLEAIRFRDRDRARSAMAAHMSTVAQRLAHSAGAVAEPGGKGLNREYPAAADPV
jgi:GntR family transcriptional repressor for pyruvate dehydrogenase complex